MKVLLDGNALEDYDRLWGKRISLVFGITILIYTVSVLIGDIYLHNTATVATSLNVLFLFIGIHLVFSRKKSVLKAVGLYSFAVALNKVPTILTFLHYTEHDVVFGLTGEVVPFVMFTVGMVFLAMSVNLCFTGYMYLTGRCRGYIVPLIAVAFMTILQLWSLFYMLKDNLSFAEYWTTYISDIAATLMYFVYMAILLSDQVYRSEIMESYRSKANQIRIATMAGYDAALLRSEAREIINGPDKWSKPVTGGPVEREYRFLVSYEDTFAYGIVQKWIDDDRLHFTLTSSPPGFTMVEATRFSSVSVHCDTGSIADCTKVTFIDPRGDPVTFGIIDERKEVVY